ncbi:hypothetical protein FisN_4Hh410 [Fistulifera solaris]|uniref:Uncharacterized protein n=1 Tax=Fistulifera solaris TaxID=1519565 RepID=A0A1Z5KQ09_FISSO|nr:hypothetical protein FisN_4Hh410 [Fistulifera solaris]|eukprot:GAX28400.1 hypothetical protein FisN_4Hh410 [Fistulifera solaris]
MSPTSKGFVPVFLFYWRNYWFPLNTPRALQLFRYENIAIPASYLVVGILQGMLRPLMNVWPLDLGATEAQQTTLAQIATLPAACKIVFGFWSDNVPIAGFRRKPYMVLGWLLCSYVVARLLHDYHLTGDYHLNQSPTEKDKPPLTFLGVTFVLYGAGLWCADVMVDSVVVQKAKIESEEQRGRLQSTCYVIRFFGLMVAATTSTYMYNAYGPASILRILMVVPLLLLPLIALMDEDTSVQPHIREQCNEIWRTVCRRSVWQPMAFIYIFNLFQVSNAAWRQFLSTRLSFGASQLNVLLVVSYIFLYIGSLTYKCCFLHLSWRRLYQVSIGINCILSSLQLLLIRQKTFGIPPYWFSLGDDAFAEFIVGIQFLPTMIVMVSLCPTGSEGASYAMFTTVFNVAQMIAPALSSSLLGIWDVSKDRLEEGDLNGMFNLTILTTLIQISPILFVGLLPHGRKELEELSKMPYSGSAIIGTVFLCILFGSVAYTVIVSITNIVNGGLS